MDISERVCLVTGATEGIGRAIAEALARRGARVAICARTAKNVKAAVAEMRAGGLPVTGTVADVANEGGVNRLRDFVHDELGPADIVINNAGLGHFAPIEKLTIRQFDETMAVNVRGVFLVTKAFLPDMRKK